MFHHTDPTMFSCRCARSETSEDYLQAAPPPAVVPVPSQPPFGSWPWESGSTSVGSSPENSSHTTTGYKYPRYGDDQRQWGFPISGHGYDARPRPIDPLDLNFVPPSLIGGPRTGPDPHFPGIGVYEVVYTDEASTKIREGMRRWCFNCRAVETTTWRRSSLSPGKLLCNRCGLFERNHRAPRPETLPIRRRARPASGLPIPDFPHLSSGEQWRYRSGHSPTIPLTQFLQPFDAIGVQPIPQSTSWMTQNGASSSSSIATGGGQRCPTSQQWSMYPGDSQM